MNIFPLLLTLTLALMATSSDASSVNKLTQKKACLDAPWTKEKLVKLKQEGFVINKGNDRNQVALIIAGCLASEESSIRDGIAFEGLSYWLREKKLTKTTQLQLFTTLVSAVEAKPSDALGVYQPFAILVLSELARADRIESYLSDEQRQRLINSAAIYLSELTDYRGFEQVIGWRHGIAHSADLFMQLSLNSKTSKEQLDIMLTAIISQVVASNEHFYIYGEPKRLVMPVLYSFYRGLHSLEEWQIWLNKVTSPSPLKSWQQGYQSQLGLAKLHNTQAFLNSLFIISQNSKNEMLIKMQPGIIKAIKTVR